MAKEYRFGFVIDGDSEKGTKSIRKVREEVEKLDSDTSKIKKNTRDWRTETDKQTGTLDKHNKTLLSTKNLIIGIAGSAGIALLARGFKDTIVETERLRGSLVTITGSTKSAADEFDRLTAFAQDTPFTLDQSVTAFIRLKSLGLDPSQRALASYGNTASAMGKDMMQMIEAVADASTLEFERLREFGIRAQQQTDTVTFTFQGVSTTVAKNSQEIQDYLLQIGEVNFAGAMNDQMERIVGKLSNLEDGADSLFRKIGDTGGLDLFTAGVDAAIVGLQHMTAGVEPTIAILSDFGSVLSLSISPFLIDLEFFIRAAGEGFVAFGQGVSVFLSSVETGFAAADNVLNTFFSNTQSGAVSTAELFQLAFGTIIPNTVAVIQTGTVAIADAYQRLKVIITKSGEEERAALALLDAARAASVNGIMDAKDEQLNALYELISTQAEQRQSVSDLVASQGELIQSTEDFIGPMQEIVKLTQSQQTALEKAKEKADDYIASLRQELQAIQMTSRAAAIYNAVMKVGTDATAEQIVEATTLAATMFDLEDAQAAAGEASKALAKASEASAKQMAKDWAETRKSFGEFFADMLEDGDSAFDALLKSFKRMLAEMTGQLALSGILKIAGVSVPGGTGDGLSSILASSGMSGTIAKTAGSALFGNTFAGIPGSASFVGPMAPGAATGGIGAYAGALASNPATWAVAALAIAAKNDFWKDPDDYKRSFAGMLTAPTAGAAGSTFSVDPFASGFRAQGIAHGADQSTATKYIDIYRELDSSIVTLIEELGGIADLSKATLAGVGIDGKFGTSGTFMGMGGKTTDADIAAMVNSYAGQLLAHVSGLDDTLMESVRAASTAEEAIAILNKAIEDQKEVSDAAQESVKAQIAAEEKLFAYRMDGINALSSELQSVMELQRSVQMSIYSAMGATPLFGTDTSGQLQALEYQRDLIISNHAAQIKAEEALHNQRIQLAQSFMDYTTSLRLGDFSNLSTSGKFDLAQSNFRSLSMAAQGGDSEALKQLQGAAEQYVTLADSMFASSGGRKDVVSEVLGIMDSLGQSLGSSTFDPSEANQALVDQLSALDSQLADINIGINNSIISELKDMNLTLSELSPKMQDSLFGAIGQWIEAQPSGESMIEALSGIKGSVDLLPPDIASYMAVALGSFLQANGNMQRTVESFNPDSITSNVGKEILTDKGFNLGYSSDQIADYVNSYGDAASNTSAIAQIYADAKANNIGSAQLGDILNYSQDQIYDALRAAGIDPTGFATGGISTGPMSGHLEMLHGTEAVIPLSGGRSIPVEMNSNRLAGNDAVVVELRVVSERLDNLIRTVAAAAEGQIFEQQKGNAHLGNLDRKTKASTAGVGSADFAKRA